MKYYRFYYDTIFEEKNFSPKIREKNSEKSVKCSLVQGQNPDGAADGDFMSEAKDWAGELISGQTGTGRILVSELRLVKTFVCYMNFEYLFCKKSKLKFII